ncbi:MAG: MerR family transcriptional regulator, partial [Acidobacteriota bacterium]
APAKGAGGQRTYSRVDVQLILRIKHLLYEERFTVAGAKKRLAEEAQPAKPSGRAAKADRESAEKTEKLRRAVADVRDELRAVVDLLR